MAKPPQIEVRVPRVFCGPDGRFGNPLGVVLDGPSVPADDRQALATPPRLLGDGVRRRRRGRPDRDLHAGVELPFAGHPTVGTAWMLAGEGIAVDVLRPPAGEVPVRRDGELTWVAARPEWCPPWELVRYGSPAEIDAMQVPRRRASSSPGRGSTRPPGWSGRAASSPRRASPRTRRPGSAALPLSAELGREIEVRQGKGSVIHARPIDDGMVEIGGRVVEG